jgi:hypothetical protein
MKSLAEINYQIAKVTFEQARPGITYAKAVKLQDRLARLNRERPNAERRALKDLAIRLNYEADVYYAGRRVFAHEAPFRYQPPTMQAPQGLYRGDERLDVNLFTDGNGNAICI